MNKENIPNEYTFGKEIIESALDIERAHDLFRGSDRRDLRPREVLAFSDNGVEPVSFGVSATRHGNIYTLGVHVADVTGYIPAGSPLDLEARRRGAAFEAASGRRELFPPNLVWDLFNIASDGEKLTLSLLLDIGVNGKMIDAQICESINRGGKRCLYDELDELRISSDSSSVMSLRRKYYEILPAIDELYNLAAMLRRERHARGGMQLDTVMRRYIRDDNANITGFARRAAPDSREMVDELIYYASAALGERMRTLRLPAVYAGLRAPELKETLRLAEAVGFKIDENAAPARAVSDLVDLCRGSEKHYLVCEELAKLTPRRRYSDKPLPECVTATDAVVLFTRPVERYADIAAHRAIKATLGRDPYKIAYGDPSYSLAVELAAVADEACASSERERREAEENRRKQLLRDGEAYDGYYIETDKGAEILLDIGLRIPASRGTKHVPGEKTVYRFLNPGKSN